MKKKLITLFVLILLLAVYDLLFRNQKLGINLSIFILLLIPLLAYLFPCFIKSRAAISSILLAAITAIMVTFINTTLSKVTGIVFAGIMVAFTHKVSLRSIPYAIAYSIFNLAQAPTKLYNGMRALTGKFPRFSKTFRYHKLAYVPVIVTVIFVIVYSIGDPEFASMLNSLVTRLADILDWLAQYFTLSHFLFLLLGAVLLLTAIIPIGAESLTEKELKQQDNLLRKKKKFIKIIPDVTFNYAVAFRRSRKLITSLMNEYRSGVLTLAMINLVLLCVNAIDVIKVWMEGQTVSNLPTDPKYVSSMRSSAVHEGTDALIFSILLAMAVLLFFFRGNINFLKGTQLLRQLAYVWIIQNALLLITVAVRNYYYITDCGLTMKRIGVYAFLLATLFGLLTLFFKILEKKSSFYLVRINCWAVSILFLLLSCVDWDPVMAQYNISHIPKEKLDKQFLLWLSDHALPVLVAHQDIFISNFSSPEKNEIKKDALRSRISDFIFKYDHHTWQSWNYADYKVYCFLKTQNLLQ